MNYVQFIVVIVTCGLYALLFLIGLFVGLYRISKQNALSAELAEMYNDPDLAKMDYDFSGYDEEVKHAVSASGPDGQLTIYDVLKSGAVAPVDEGIEEITGNYKPD